jgi:hypothetical protein
MRRAGGAAVGRAAFARSVARNALMDAFFFGTDPRYYRERASKLREWAADTSDEKVRADFHSLAIEYERLAENVEKRTATTGPAAPHRRSAAPSNRDE